MTARPQWSRDHVQLLFVVILLILLVTFLVDLAGWFHDGWLPS